MTMPSNDRRHQKRAPFFDVDAVTGVSIEVFYADRTLETFGRGGAGWFWWPRRRGFAAYGPAVGPFPTSYSAYRDALRSRTDPRQFGERSPGFRLCADRAGGCMRQGAAEQIASEAARAAARAEPDSVQNLLEYQLLVATTGGESVRRDMTSRHLRLSQPTPFLEAFQAIDGFTPHHGASSNCSRIDGCDDG